MSARDADLTLGRTPAGGTSEPSEFAEPPDSEEDAQRKAALAEPGLSWKEWSLYVAARWWGAILFLIIDAWIAETWLQTSFVWGLFPSLAAAIYAEFLLYRYLWHRPPLDEAKPRGGFRRSWTRPVKFGRWTPEGMDLRAGRPVIGYGSRPDPREFR